MLSFVIFVENRDMDAIRRVQTAFRLEESLLRRLKKKAQAQNKSLNRYVEELFLADVRDEPEYPVVSFPVRHADCVTRMLDILPGFSGEELQEDEKLAYILGK